MADPLNPSFEIAGTHPGEALNWTLSIFFAGWMIGDFSGGVGNPRPLESFEQSPFAYSFTGAVQGVFDQGSSPDPGNVESFGFWSGNRYYHRTTGHGAAGGFADLSSIESFNEPAELYVTTFSGGPSFSEAFGSDYSAAYVTTFSGGTPSSFYQGGSSIESMQFVQPDVLFAVPVFSNSTLVCTTAHGLTNGRKTTLRSTGSPPGGLTTNAEYFVVSATSTTLKLSLTSGGAAITLTSAGVGTHRLHADETLFWTDGP